MSNAIEEMRTLKQSVAASRGRRTAQTGRDAGVSSADVMELLASAEFKAQLEKCVPKNVQFDVARMVRRVRAAYREDRNLALCEPQSILGAALQCAELALMPGMGGQAFLKAEQHDSAEGFTYEAQVIPGYRGLIALAMRDERVASISARIVTKEEIEAGRFDLTYEGDRDVLLHRPIFEGDEGTPALAYCLVRFKNGSFYVECMRRADIERIKQRALERVVGGAERSAWVTDESEMWRKTVIRRALKYVDLDSAPMERALQLQEDTALGRTQGLAVLVPQAIREMVGTAAAKPGQPGSEGGGGNVTPLRPLAGDKEEIAGHTAGPGSGAGDGGAATPEQATGVSSVDATKGGDPTDEVSIV